MIMSHGETNKSTLEHLLSADKCKIINFKAQPNNWETGEKTYNTKLLYFLMFER